MSLISMGFVRELLRAQAYLEARRRTGADQSTIRYHERAVCRCLDQLWEAQGRKNHKISAMERYEVEEHQS